MNSIQLHNPVVGYAYWKWSLTLHFLEPNVGNKILFRLREIKSSALL